MDSPFVNLGLSNPFVQAVEQLNFDQPTPIQMAAIPALLQGRDVVGQAQTGTGKTAAYALPMLQKIEPGKGSVQALVLAPTRELAIQVAEATSQMASHCSARVLAIYGGQPYRIQTRQLEHGVDIVVGTPGRLLDLIDQGVLDLPRGAFPRAGRSRRNARNGLHRRRADHHGAYPPQGADGPLFRHPAPGRAQAGREIPD